MLTFALTDLDELVLTVRNVNTREHISEAVHAYRLGLNRAAVILTWTAVAYDLIAKYRELAEQGERAAVQFTSDLDQAISTKNIAQLQSLENRLLELARDPFEIIDGTERDALERLKEERNLCAHPAFTGENILFNPLPEQVRAHIVQAAKALLQNPPAQGKAAFGRLRADMLQPSFPTSPDHVQTFLSNRYLGSLKKSLTSKLVSILAREVILQSDVELATVPENVVRVLIAVGKAYPQEYENQLKDGLPKYAGVADDEKLWRLLLIVGNDSRVWAWLDEPTRIRVRNLINGGKVKADQTSYLALAFKVSELAAILRQRFEVLEDEKKEKFIAAIPVVELSDEAIRIFANSGSYRTAETRAKNLIVPLAPVFTPEQIRRILGATAENGEIWDAAEIPEIMRNFYRLTKNTHEATHADWQAFVVRVQALRESKNWPVVDPAAPGTAD